MSKFVGNWILEKSEGFEDYLRATGMLFILIFLIISKLIKNTKKGVPAEHVKMAASIKPTVTVRKEGTHWKININTPVKNDVYQFTENQPFIETSRNFKLLFNYLS